MKRILLTTLFLTLIAIAGAASAIEPIPAEPGWSGFVNVGAGVLSAKTNMVEGIRSSINIGESTISSLTAAPQTVTVGMPVLNLNINYTFSTQTQLFLGNTVENIIELDRASNAGVRQQFADKSILELALVSSPFAMPVRVWQDPYVVGVARQETDRTSRGARIEYDKILGSGFGVQYSARRTEIDDERSGTTQLGLPPEEADLLNRNGTVSRLSVHYRFPKLGRNVFQVRVGRSKDDLDGDAMSGEQNEIQLTHAYLGDRFVTGFSVFYWKEDYNAVNPVFNQTREDKTFGLAFNIFDRKIFNSKNWWGLAQAVWVNQDSNINFYDASSLLVSLSAMYRF